MHLRPISRDLRKDLFGRYKKSKRDRDRSPGCASLPSDAPMTCQLAADCVVAHAWKS